MKVHKPNTDQVAELTALVNNEETTEYALPTESDGQFDELREKQRLENPNMLECFIAVKPGDKISIKGKFSGTVLGGRFDFVADGAFVQESLIGANKDGAPKSTEPKYANSRPVKCDHVLDLPIPKDWPSKEFPKEMFEGYLHAKELNSEDLQKLNKNETAIGGSVKPGVGSLMVVVNINQSTEEEHNDPYPDMTLGHWRQRGEQQVVRKSGIMPSMELELRKKENTAVSNKRSRKHRTFFESTKPGVQPWAKFVFYYRLKEHIDARGCIKRPVTTHELQPMGRKNLNVAPKMTAGGCVNRSQDDRNSPEDHADSEAKKYASAPHSPASGNERLNKLLDDSFEKTQHRSKTVSPQTTTTPAYKGTNNNTTKENLNNSLEETQQWTKTVFPQTTTAPIYKGTNHNAQDDLDDSLEKTQQRTKTASPQPATTPTHQGTHNNTKEDLDESLEETQQQNKTVSPQTKTAPTYKRTNNNTKEDLGTRRSAPPTMAPKKKQSKSSIYSNPWTSPKPKKKKQKITPETFPNFFDESGKRKRLGGPLFPDKPSSESPAPVVDDADSDSIQVLPRPGMITHKSKVLSRSTASAEKRTTDMGYKGGSMLHNGNEDGIVDIKTEEAESSKARVPAEFDLSKAVDRAKQEAPGDIWAQSRICKQLIKKHRRDTDPDYDYDSDKVSQAYTVTSSQLFEEDLVASGEDSLENKERKRLGLPLIVYEREAPSAPVQNEDNSFVTPVASRASAMGSETTPGSRKRDHSSTSTPSDDTPSKRTKTSSGKRDREKVRADLAKRIEDGKKKVRDAEAEKTRLKQENDEAEARKKRKEEKRQKRDAELREIEQMNEEARVIEERLREAEEALNEEQQRADDLVGVSEEDEESEEE